MELNKPSEALDAVNRIRERAGIALLASVDREKIRHERRVEFAFEDIRGWDIIRWGIQDEVMSGIPGSKWVKGKCELWPLPAFVLDENPNIKENNPGW